MYLGGHSGAEPLPPGQDPQNFVRQAVPDEGAGLLCGRDWQGEQG